MTVFEEATRNFLSRFQLSSPIHAHHFRKLYLTTVISGVILLTVCVLNLIGGCLAIFAYKKRIKVMSLFILCLTVHLLLVIIALQLIGGSYGYTLTEKLTYEAYVERYTVKFEAMYFHSNQSTAKTDVLHQLLRCCGVNGTADYAKRNLPTPKSCCLLLGNSTDCNTEDLIHVHGSGCVDRMYEVGVKYVYEFFRVTSLCVGTSTLFHLVAIVCIGMLIFVIMVQKR